MDADGSNQKLLAGARGFGGRLAWSPDGKRIAFRRTGYIFVMNADGGGWRQLTSTSGTHDDEEPAWSPDGKKIVFSSNRDGNWELYIMDANGKNQTRLTHTPAAERNPAWSPR
jgi:TolB protein